MDFTCLSFALLRSPQPVGVKSMIIFWAGRAKAKARGEVLQAAEQLEGVLEGAKYYIRKMLLLQLPDVRVFSEGKTGNDANDSDNKKQESCSGSFCNTKNFY